MHFDAILHDFRLPFGSLISVYEWSSKHVEMRNFHQFLKRFLLRKNRFHMRFGWIPIQYEELLGAELRLITLRMKTKNQEPVPERNFYV